jgi:PTH1 family peptidyl-tRNA hydrolase
MITIVAKVFVKDEKMDQVIEAFKAVIEHEAQAEGTCLYSLNRDDSQADYLVVIEQYRDKKALEEHASAPHSRELSATLSELVAAKSEISLLREIYSIESGTKRDTEP